MHDRTTMACLLIALVGCAPAASRPDHETPRHTVRNEAAPTVVAGARPPEVVPPAVSERPVVRADDGPLTAKIDAATPAARATALRLTEEARQRLGAGDPNRAAELLERAVAVDARLPYPYYFLAQAHADLQHAQLAQRFLDRAGQKLAHEPYWKSRVEELRGRLLADAGKPVEAEAAYRRALDAWPGNRAASEALTAGSQRGKETGGGAP
jgi:hypothetical protein